MTDTNKDRTAIYEIGYLIATSIPEEKVAGEVEVLRKIVTDAGSEVITEEAPHLEQLAYEMRKKTVSGSYDKYDRAYFGWIKFEIGTEKIDGIKKAFEVHPSVLRMLVLSTVREQTYLGKRAAQAITAEIAPKLEVAVEAKVEAKSEKAVEEIIGTPATVEEMDKSIDAMVKEA